ncbi:sugar phosphate isomerase/epimerase family protein [Pseudomonas baltica]|uniref:sugar phosphate isomerase/epimerase family protein n=1 Tax=Pseudomonas baltica TaxID=2762576 RepID=UPI00289F4C74|nr:sugar phosphate isomerase/epimerase family protein [Pseudomonas baltica]
MSVGIVTWTLGISAAAPVIAKAKALGMDSIQYAGDFRDGPPALLRELARAAGIGIIAVDPFNAGPPEPAKATQDAAIAYYRQVVDFAAELGPVPVTLQGLSQWTLSCKDPTSARARLLACCKAVDAYAASRGVRTLYEVCNHYEVPLIHTAAQCRQLLAEMDSDNVRMILDSFHMNIDEPDPLQALREHGAFTAIYHISDSGRGGIGTGHIDFKAQHEALVEGGFSGAVATELVPEHLTPTQPPRTAADHQALEAQIRHSAEIWRSYVNAGPINE